MLCLHSQSCIPSAHLCTLSHSKPHCILAIILPFTHSCVPSPTWQQSPQNLHANHPSPATPHSLSYPVIATYMPDSLLVSFLGLAMSCGFPGWFWLLEASRELQGSTHLTIHNSHLMMATGSAGIAVTEQCNTVTWHHALEPHCLAMKIPFPIAVIPQVLYVLCNPSFQILERFFS